MGGGGGNGGQDPGTLPKGLRAQIQCLEISRESEKAYLRDSFQEVCKLTRGEMCVEVDCKWVELGTETCCRLDSSTLVDCLDCVCFTAPSSHLTSAL